MTKKPQPKKSKPAAKSSPGTLPGSIINALPAAAVMMKHLVAAAEQLPELDKQLAKAKKGGAVQMARAFVAMHRMVSRMDELFKPLTGKDMLFDRYKTNEIPALFEIEGITSLPLAEGFRVGLSSRFLASIKPDQKEAAYQWLRDNGLGELIVGTVNAQTLSAAGKRMLEDDNKELPEGLFNVAMVPNTSVTKTDSAAK